jgi:hypothetical protein
MTATAKWIWNTASGSLIDLTSTTVNPSAAPTSTPRQGGFTLRNRFDGTQLAGTSIGSNSYSNDTLWEAADAPSSSSNTEPVSRMKILEVPERTYVKDLHVYAVKSETAPITTFTPIATVHASDLENTVIFAGAYQNDRPTSSASYVEASDLVQLTSLNAVAEDGSAPVAGHVFGDIPMTKSTLVPTWAMSAVDSTIASAEKPMTTSFFFQQYDASSAGIEKTMGHYFPYGGYVYMALGPYATKLGSASSAADITDFYASSTGATITVAGVWDVQANCNYVPE